MIRGLSSCHSAGCGLTDSQGHAEVVKVSDPQKCKEKNKEVKQKLIGVDIWTADGSMV